MKRTALILLALSLVACQNVRRAPSPAAGAATPPAAQGVFDNHAQVWQSRESSPGAAQPPHVVVAIEPTNQPDWALWRVQLDASPPIEALWAMHSVTQADGALAFVPHRRLVATPAVAPAFDPAQWAALDACTLRTPSRASTASTDVAACAAIVPGIGADAALLPLAIERDGEWLHVRFYADQARGADAREDLRLVRWFTGWAAINGGGPKADAASRDWHMDRTLRIGSEGGRYPLKWRDGNASGYSLVLERLTYREGNVPVLKLSVVADADASTLAYAWANPEATRIGINLGWVQVGLDLESAPTK
ncbi:MAG TPA: hypothetical protein VI258_09820 [Rhodanobacteraceae bacterium]